MLPGRKRIKNYKSGIQNVLKTFRFKFNSFRKHYAFGGILGITLFLTLLFRQPVTYYIISPIVTTLMPLKPLQETKKGYEVFGFAPHWTLERLNNVDFNILTTFAYFGIPVNRDGSLDTSNRGYEVFKSDHATEIFKKAHDHGTRVVLTITQMNNDVISEFLNSPASQKRAIEETVRTVQGRGIDGVNVDFEYIGDPGSGYRASFSKFVYLLSQKMHAQIPSSQVTVSVYASSVKEPKMYNIGKLAESTDGVFIMAYDFATSASDHAIPTSPLYGYKEGKYWYDVSTAVDDFLRVMPAEKLILGVPWYGYNYPVNTPEVKADVNPGYYTYYWYKWRQYSEFHPYSSVAQTYSLVHGSNSRKNSEITDVTTGWDEYGEVGWKAYMEDGIWRMIFMEDSQSLSLKYDFAKNKQLKGVGMWALGFDSGTHEMWNLLARKFGAKLADSSVIDREINQLSSYGIQ